MLHLCAPKLISSGKCDHNGRPHYAECFTTKLFPAMSCHRDWTTDGQPCCCQIWTSESIKRHSKGSMWTDTTNTTGLLGPTEAWNCFAMLISFPFSRGYHLLWPLLIKNCLLLKLLGRHFPCISPFLVAAEKGNERRF